MDLRPYQLDGVEFLKERKYALLADDMGLGKTIQLLTATQEIDAKRIIIVCPASIKRQWAGVVEEALNQKALVLNSVTDKIPSDTDIIIVNYDLLTFKNRTIKTVSYPLFREIFKYTEKNPFDVCILDEAHYLKSHNSLRSRLLLGRASFLKNCSRAWLATGTPIMNRPADLYPILKTFAPEAIEGYEDWIEFGRRYCAGYRTTYGWQMTGASHIEELSDALSGFMLRRTKEEVAPELPPLQEEIVEIDSGICEFSQANSLLPELRKKIAFHRYKDSLQYIKNCIEQVDKLIIFCHHRGIIETLECDLINHKPAIIYGGQDSGYRDNVINRFCNDPRSNVLLAQIHAAGIGIDGLQSVCNNIIFMEIDWSPGTLKQATDRLRRIGQKKPVFVKYLIAPGTIEEDIYKLVEKKKAVIKKVLKERTPMNLTNNVELLLSAIENLTSAVEGLKEYATGVSKDSEPPAPARRGRTAAVKPEPVAEEAPPEQSTIILTSEDLVVAVEMFLNTLSEADIPPVDGKAYIREEILKKAGFDKLAEVTDAARKDVYERLILGSPADVIKYKQSLVDSDDL